MPFPFKSIQIDDSFRAEKPQVGRNRQLTQCDVDIFGVAGIIGEIEIITTTMEAYYNVGLKNVVCKISNRKILTAIIRNCGVDENRINDVCIVIDKLDKIGSAGCKNELIEIGIDENTIALHVIKPTDNNVPTKEYFLAKKGILEIDKEAIILINDVYQSTGLE